MLVRVHGRPLPFFMHIDPRQMNFDNGGFRLFVTGCRKKSRELDNPY